MSTQFHVGEICILQNASKGNEKYNGEECLIVGGLDHYNRYYGSPSESSYELGYLIKFGDGIIFFARAYKLRRKEDPPDTTQWAKSKVRDLLKTIEQVKL